MRRACVLVLAVLGLTVPGVAAASYPYRQPCVGSWNSVNSISNGSATLFQFEGEIACGINVPHYLPSQMNFRVPKATCNGGFADGSIEIRASGQDIWAYAKFWWGPGGGAIELPSPESFGAVYVRPYHDPLSGNLCPIGFSITSSFVYNTLDGTKIPPA